MIVNEDFKFRDDLVKTASDTVPIELLTGRYKGVIFRYTTVAIREQENLSAKLQFDYDLLETGKHTKDFLEEDKKFEFHIGLILNTLILEATEDPKDTDGSREDNTQEPVEV